MSQKRIYLPAFWSLVAILFLFSCSQTHPLKTEKIRVLHWNDFHSSNVARKIESDKGYYYRGGAAILSSALKTLEDGKIPTVKVHAGDELQGSPISSITRGASQIRLLNLLKPDVFAVGNHDFDYGRFRLDTLLQKAHFSVICANLFDKQQGRLLFSPYKIIKEGQARLAFVGLIIPELSRIVLRDRIPQLSVLDPARTVRHYIEMLGDSADVFIVVSHMGIEEDEKLAQKVPEIDLIIGGHSHTVLKKPRRVNGVPIVQAGSYGRFLGELLLTVDVKRDTILALTYNLHALNSRYFAPDSAVQAVVDSLEEVVSADLEEVVARLETDWVRDRQGESNIGDWITDAMRAYTGADVAFQNSGGIRKNLRKGPVTKRDFWEIAPFGNQIVTFEVTGSELLRILEKAVSGEGSLLQGSGFIAWYNPASPKFKRVKRVLVAGRPLEANRRYRIATNYFVFDHFYEELGISPNDLEKRNVSILNKTVRDVLIETAKIQKVISSKVEGRYRKMGQ